MSTNPSYMPVDHHEQPMGGSPSRNTPSYASRTAPAYAKPGHWPTEQTHEVPRGGSESMLPPNGKEGYQETPMQRRHVSWHRHLVHFLTRFWIWEFIGCFGSILCIGCLAIVGAVANGQLVETLEDIGAAPSSVISFITTVMRIAIMVPISVAIGQHKWFWFTRRKGHSPRPMKDLKLFDDASRGPAGSAILLVRRFGLHTSTFGAFLTLATLMLGFTSQRVVTTVNGIAERRALPQYQAFNFSFSNQWQPETLQFLKAFSDSLSLTSDVDALVPYCETGNCTWPTFPTLGLCSSCEDRTPTVQEDCTTPVEGQGDSAVNYCGYVPSDEDDNFRNLWGIFRREYLPVYDTYRETTNLANNTGVPVFRVDGYRSNINTLQVDPLRYFWLRIQDNTRPGSQRPTVTDCSFRWCFQALNTSMESFNVTSKKVGEWTKLIPEDKNDSLTFDNNLPPEFNLNDTFKGDFIISGFPTIQGFETLVATSFNRTAAKEQIDFTNVRDASLYLQRDALDVWAGRAATFATNALRRARGSQTLEDYRYPTSPYDPPNSPYEGSSFRPQPVYRTRWMWLLYPAVLTILAIILLFCTIIMSHRHKLEHWKNEILPILYTRVDQDILARASEPEDIREEEVYFLRSSHSSNLVRAEAYDNYHDHHHDLH